MSKNIARRAAEFAVIDGNGKANSSGEESAERRELRNSIAELTAVQARHDAAKLALERAQGVVVNVAEHLHKFNDLESRITSYRADRIKAWSRTTGDVSNPPALDLTEEFAAELVEQKDAAARVTAAQQACALLSADHEIEKRALDAAKNTVRHAAVTVAHAEASALAEEYLVLCRRRREIRDRLFGFTDFVSTFRRLSGFHLTQWPTHSIVETARDPEPQLAGNQNPIGDQMRAWHRYCDQLAENPDAVMF
jgi:hypothetical protein